ncbi:MAG TPA: VOC family protein [Kofleriaceae bacterium]|nr:VOC family protein [Kofleriaceae bacterium]
MKLNHLDLQVTDVPALTRFLIDHFDLHALTRLDSPRLAVLGDGAGFTLVLQHRAAPPAGDDGALGHIGFLVDDPAAVHDRHARLVAAGVAVSPVGSDARGTRCYLRAPGVLIEIGCNTRRSLRDQRE